MFKSSGEKEWYFFTPRDKKYKNGRRPNRAAGGGHWKATGAEKHITHNGEIIGLCQMLTYNKSLEKNSKTDWLMHEYKVRNSHTTQVNTMRLHDWVLCKVYKKTSSSSTTDDWSSSVDVAPLPFPYNMLRLGLSFEPSSDPTQNRVGSLSNTINIYDELKHGEGTNMVAKKIHIASSHSIPTSNCFSSFGVGQFSLSPHYQQVPSFASVESINGTTTHSSHFQVSEEAPNWT
ncbi:NAC Apical domain transcriptional regulator superfamily protein [Perilla frutescens var. frutescens]|nr:NAC Apical domain transcriptional regulator superfamily protein [Perilla frutescens var. frutescens]